MSNNSPDTAPDSYDVVGAASARQALNLLEVKECDLMLLDVMLPDASGFELCRRLRESDGLAQRIDPELPAIMLTGRNGQGVVVNRGAPNCRSHAKAGVSSARAAAAASRLERAPDQRCGWLTLAEAKQAPETSFPREAGQRPDAARCLQPG